MIIRLRSPNGVDRVEVEPANPVAAVWQKASESTGQPVEMLALTVTGPGGRATWRPLDPKRSGTVAQAGLKHGDLVHVDVAMAGGAAAAPEPAPVALQRTPQDPLDDFLEKQRGTIERSRQPLCKHGPQGMCEYCMPVEPYDAAYLEANKVKHMSFHAYLKSVQANNKSAVPDAPHFVPPLAEDDFRLRQPCAAGHPNYPLGICSKCQPSAVTLQQQTFRMVDYVEFETPALIEQLLSFWRRTGSQRLGFLLGRYEPYDKVPLGVKAVVAAVYEPEQHCYADGIQLQRDKSTGAFLEQAALDAAAALNLAVVGVLYSDCVDDGQGRGSVVCKRHAQSYFMSGAECLFAASLQLAHPTRSRYSASGRFGSRFVTCVLSGNDQGQIDVFAYQVSNTAMAMLRDGVMEASVDPSLLRVRQPTREEYVPDVFYSFKNEYGIEVKRAATPLFPVDYLLVSVAHGFPAAPAPTLRGALDAFPIEHREALAPQTVSALAKVLRPGRTDAAALARAVGNFHIVRYILSLGVLEPDAVRLLGRLALADPSLPHVAEIARELASCTSWATLESLLEAELGTGRDLASTSAGPSGTSGAAGSDTWACPHCTFLNAGGSAACSMCGLPPS